MMLRYKDRLICRYLDGLMNQTERQAFLRRLEVDTSLRETLRLEENIRAMMLRDAASIPAMQHAVSARANALSTLVVTPPPPPRNGRGRMAGEDASSAPFSSRGFGGMAMKALLGVLLAGAIVVVVAMLFNTSDLPPRDDARPAGTMQRSAPGMEGRSGVERIEGSATATTPTDRSVENASSLDRKGASDGVELKGSGAERSAGREGEEMMSQRTSRGNLKEGEAAGADSRERRSPRQSEDGTVRKQSDPAHAEQSMQPTQSLPENAPKPPVFQSSHIRPTVKIDSGRK